MRKIKHIGLLVLAVILLHVMASCSKDDNGNSPKDPVETKEDDKVVINADGTTSNGSIFSAIDDKNFYLDYIKYSVEEGHLVVSGYDKVGFKGEAKIVTSITINGKMYEVKEIKTYAFSECSILTSVTIQDGITSIGTSAFYGCIGLTSVGIPNSVTKIEAATFQKCSGLTAITIPNSVISIGSAAFRGCSALTSITIPKSVTSIGGLAFHACSGLTSIVVESGNPAYDSRNNCNAIIETASNTLIKGCVNTTIPNNVSTIGENAFYRCDGITSITIPSSVTSIESSAFWECSSLVSITIPNGVTSIGENAFGECSGLTFVSIPSSVTTIGSSAFYGCSSLTDVNCLAEKIPTTGGNVFNGMPMSKAILHVPAASVEAYKVADAWKDFGSIVALNINN